MSSASAASPEELPEQFGRFRIIKKLGQGATGVVYLAHDPDLDRQFALKVLLPSASENPQMLARFQREARSAGKLRHPNICPVFEVGEFGGIHYLAMGYVDGRPLAQFVKEGKPLRPRQAAKLVRTLALALEQAHLEGIVHRDLKPANILINTRLEPVIVDFGLARSMEENDRLTRTGTAVGTPAYMAPEQIRGVKEVGAACDVYSLGVILYELMTGKVPFDGPLATMLNQVLRVEPEPPDKVRPEVGAELSAICLKALAKKVEDRYASMATLANAVGDYLRRHKTEKLQPVSPAPAAPGSPPTVRPRPTAATESGRVTQQQPRLRPDETPGARYDPHTFQRLFSGALLLYAASAVAALCGGGAIAAGGASDLVSLLPVGCFALACLLAVAAVVLSAIQLYLSWAQIQDGQARTSPARAVGLLLVPLFNLYWVFVAVYGLAQDLNAYARRHEVPIPPVNQRLCLAFCVATCLTPFTVGVTAVPGLVLFLLVLRSLKEASVGIADELRARLPAD